MGTETLQIEVRKQYHLYRGSFGEWGQYIGRGKNGAHKFASFVGNEQDCLAVIEIPEEDMIPDGKNGFELEKNLEAYPLHHARYDTDEFAELIEIMYGDKPEGGAQEE